MIFGAGTRNPNQLKSPWYPDLLMGSLVYHVDADWDPEAGVWVIAETTELPTKFARIVVTDDQGRYLVPDLPAANYSVWVRGYGLVDSDKLTAKPGQLVNLTAVPAPNEAAAAHYYPAIYWYAMMKIPPAKDFGGSTDIPKAITRENWIRQMNNTDCIGCHQLGQEATRPHRATYRKLARD